MASWFGEDGEEDVEHLLASPLLMGSEEMQRSFETRVMMENGGREEEEVHSRGSGSDESGGTTGSSSHSTRGASMRARSTMMNESLLVEEANTLFGNGRSECIGEGSEHVRGNLSAGVGSASSIELSYPHGAVLTLGGERGAGGRTGGNSGLGVNTISPGEFYGIADLDDFLIRLYSYYRNHGLVYSLAAGIINLCMLGFTVVASLLILLIVDWNALLGGCPHDDTHCDLGHVILKRKVLSGSAYEVCVIIYIVLLGVYWLWSAYRLASDVPRLLEMRRFVTRALRIEDGELQRMPWKNLVQRVVDVQDTLDLCAVRRLNHHDIIGRIMRKDNYLIAMMNAGAVDLAVAVPGYAGAGAHLTKTLEWNLRLCVLDFMFDGQFLLRRDFMYDVVGLRRRFRVLGIMNLCFSPFVLIFMITFFFLRNAEDFYHQPGSIGQRRWSELARWRFREFNEMPHLFERRLQHASKPASRFVDQFPTPLRSLIAKFVTFIAGSFAAFLILLAFIDESLLEARILSKTILWYAAVLGTILAVARSFITEQGAESAIDPERTMRDVAQFTHYMPSHWRGKCDSREVVAEFQGEMYEYKFVVFLREIASILITPLILFFYLPEAAASILSFIQQHTVSIDGVGDVCSLAAFVDAGSFIHPHCKVEKALVCFKDAYPAWEPEDEKCRNFLQKLDAMDATSDGSSRMHTTGYTHTSDSGRAAGHVPSILHRRGPLSMNHLHDDSGRDDEFADPRGYAVADSQMMSHARRQRLVLKVYTEEFGGGSSVDMGPRRDDGL